MYERERRVLPQLHSSSSIVYHIKPVVGAIEVSHAACKMSFDEILDLRPMTMETRCSKVIFQTKKETG